MQKVSLAQGSDEWLEWRKGGLGSSDASAIMGVSPWKTPYQLWLEKVGKVKSPPSNFAMQRGNHYEEEARQWFNFTYNMDMEATCYQSAELPWLRVSLDGINPSEDEILEIKCPGRGDHFDAVDGKVPAKYKPQIQMQLLVTGAKKAYYLSYFEEEGIVVEVMPDLVYQEHLLEKLVDFMDCIHSEIAPELLENDCLLIEDDELLQHAAHAWRKANMEYKELKKKVDFWKSKIVELSDDGNIMGYGVQLKRICRSGQVDYANVVAKIKEESDFSDERLAEVIKENTKEQIGYWKVSEAKCLIS